MNLLSLAISRKLFSPIFAMDGISAILLKYFKVLYFTNLVCTLKFLKYKTIRHIQDIDTLYNQDTAIIRTPL